MAQPDTKGTNSSRAATMEQAIPMIARRFGSWEVLINRRRISSADLARRYDAVAGKWARTARRFRLDAAYSEPLSTSQVVIDLMQVEPQARILDCGVGNGSLSIALDSLMQGPADFHAIDTSTEMLMQAKSVMQHAELDPHLQQADVMSLPYEDQSFDVVMQAQMEDTYGPPSRVETGSGSVSLIYAWSDEGFIADLDDQTPRKPRARSPTRPGTDARSPKTTCPASGRAATPTTPPRNMSLPTHAPASCSPAAPPAAQPAGWIDILHEHLLIFKTSWSTANWRECVFTGTLIACGPFLPVSCS